MHIRSPIEKVSAERLRRLTAACRDQDGGGDRVHCGGIQMKRDERGGNSPNATIQSPVQSADNPPSARSRPRTWLSSPASWIPAGLRVRSLLLMLLTMVPALALFVSTAVEHRRVAGVAARQEVSQIARLAATRHDILVDDARDLLLTFRYVPEVRAGIAGAPSCDDFLASMLRQHPRYAAFGVTTPDGDLTCSSIPRSSPINVADRT